MNNLTKLANYFEHKISQNIGTEQDKKRRAVDQLLETHRKLLNIIDTIKDPALAGQLREVDASIGVILNMVMSK